jgi:hypothetical protein
MRSNPRTRPECRTRPSSRVRSSGDPTIAEALSDPIVKAVMEADRVDRRHLEAMLTVIVTQLARNKRHSAN